MKYLLVILFLVSSVSFAADSFYGDVIITEVISIYDADTFRVNIMGWPDIIGFELPIRVMGVDAPEMRGQCAKEKTAAQLAKQFTVTFLHRADVIELKHIKRGKYFRLLADVYGDGKNLAD